MSRVRVARSLLTAVLVVVAVGCSAPTAPTATPGPRATRKPGPGVAGDPVAPGPTTSPTAQLPRASGAPPTLAPSLLPASPLASGLPSVLAGLSIAGVVRVPAAIISNNGGGLISDRGGSLVSDQGGSIVSNNGGGFVGRVRSGADFLGAAAYRARGYRLRQAAPTGDALLARAVVQLLDADGRPVLRDGQPVQAVTNERGAYTLALPPGASNRLLHVALPGTAGGVVAIAAPGAAPGTPVDLDLVSTLATGYILDRYVAARADDRQATLDRLPADVEAATRASAKAALGAPGAAPPASFTPEDVVRAVNGLRRSDAAFDAQLEEVRRLLIPAGQSNLGAGRPGTEVALSTVRAMVRGFDGALYFSCPYDRRIWRLGPDGRLANAAGNGEAQAAAFGPMPALKPIDGMKGPDAPLIGVRGLAVDDDGRPILLEYEADIGAFARVGDFGLGAFPGSGRVSRLERDGKLTTLWEASVTGRAAVPGLAGEVLVVTTGVGPEAATLTAIKPDKTREVRHRFDSADTTILRDTEASGRDGSGRVYLGTKTGDIAAGFVWTVYRFTPATKTLEKLLDTRTDGLAGLALDPAGNLFTVEASGALVVRRPDGTRTTLAASVPAGLKLTLFGGAVLTPDGGAYLRLDLERVYRVSPAGAFEAVAGIERPASLGSDLALAEPGGVAVGADGAIFVADRTRHQIHRVAPDGQAAVVAGSGTAGWGADGEAATATEIVSPRALRVTAGGDVYLVERHPDLFATDQSDAAGTFTNLCAAATPLSRVTRVGADGARKTVFQAPDRIVADLAVAANGTLYVGLYDPCTHRGGISMVGPTGTTSVVLAEGAVGAAATSLALDPLGVLHAAIGGELFKLGEAGMAKVEAGKAGAFPAGDLYHAGSLACDGEGRFYVAHREGNAIARFDPRTRAWEAMVGAAGVHFTGTGVDDGVRDPRYPTIGPDGALVFADVGNRQVKRVPADRLGAGKPR